ncbi:BlaI/MecI/CopY family transcriptional regulator [Micromonospora globbae]|uniref:BlaI/MecI/CopY family transcriptional regulator n=1 Tax=Micromonospora globbae TaxID=1894969 RepID=UPI0037995463
MVRGSLEADVMAVLWGDQRSLRVRDVLARLNADRDRPLAYTTVMTVLTRLVEKGFAVRHPDGRSYRYAASAADEAAVAVRHVLARHGDAAVAGFLTEVSADPDLLRRLRRLLDEEH